MTTDRHRHQRRDDGGDLPHHGDFSRPATPGLHPGYTAAGSARPHQAAEALPPALTADPPALLAYRVQILNAHGRSAGPSPEAFAASGAAPPPVEQLRATPTREGAMLEWQQTDSLRPGGARPAPVGPDGVVIEPAPPKAPPKSRPNPPSKTQKASPQNPATAPAPTHPKPPQMTSARSRRGQAPDARPSPPTPAEPSTTPRRKAKPTVTPPSESAPSRSAATRWSCAARLVARHGRRCATSFLRTAPTGLEAVPGGATAADRSIDLSWTPNTEADLAGYIVYRQEIDCKRRSRGHSDAPQRNPGRRSCLPRPNRHAWPPVRLSCHCCRYSRQ